MASNDPPVIGQPLGPISRTPISQPVSGTPSKAKAPAKLNPAKKPTKKYQRPRNFIKEAAFAQALGQPVNAKPRVPQPNRSI